MKDVAIGLLAALLVGGCALLPGGSVARKAAERACVQSLREHGYEVAGIQSVSRLDGSRYEVVAKVDAAIGGTQPGRCEYDGQTRQAHPS